MAHKYADRVKEVSLTVGTGNYSLAGAGVSFESFAQNLSDGDTCYYVCELDENWEVGTGTYQNTNVLIRTAIHASSNTGSAVNWPVGSKTIALTAAAEYFRARAYTDTEVDNLIGNHSHVEVDITDLDKYTQTEIHNYEVDAGYF